LRRAISVPGAGIAVILLVSSALAQSAPTGDTARGRSAKDAASTGGPEIWDANHDGIYTCAEWKSYLDRLFTYADRNRDGHLDPSEFPTVRRAGATFADAEFGYFDENQDGKISRGEFVDKPSEFILQHDKDGDCRVTQDEMKSAGDDQKPPARRGKKF
jgi:EF hand domain-containing protein